MTVCCAPCTVLPDHSVIVDRSPFFTVSDLHSRVVCCAVLCCAVLRVLYCPPDLGVIVDGSPFFTVSDLQLGVTQRRAATYDGTWGIWLKNAADVLITRFNISAVFTQDIAVQAVQASTVISNGVGRNLSINPLYAGPYGILVSNVNFGQASLPYGLSGVAPKVSSFFTFWNVKVSVHNLPAESGRSV